MTAAEFKAWLTGYMEAGGRDVDVIAKKAATIRTDHLATPPYYPPTTKVWNGATSAPPHDYPPKPSITWGGAQ